MGMEGVRDIVDTHGSDVDAIVFSFPMLFWEGLAEVYYETVYNISLALAMVFLCCLVFLESTTMAVLCLANIALIDVCLLGFLYHAGMYLNNVTVINLLLALGLTVDYSAHIAHSYHTAPASITDRNERVRWALDHIGVSVFNGAMTTFVAILALSWATSYVFQNYFRCFLLIISLGVYFGMVVLPTVLSVIGPVPDGPTGAAKMSIKPSQVVATETDVREGVSLEMQEK